jgi:hypothetical protein
MYHRFYQFWTLFLRFGMDSDSIRIDTLCRAVGMGRSGSHFICSGVDTCVVRLIFAVDYVGLGVDFSRRARHAMVVGAELSADIDRHGLILVSYTAG